MKRPGGQRCPPPAGTVMLHRFEPPSPQTTLSCRLPLVEGPQHAATETSSELWLTPSIGRTAYFFNRYAYEAQPVNSSDANLEAATFADVNSTGIGEPEVAAHGTQVPLGGVRRAAHRCRRLIVLPCQGLAMPADTTRRCASLPSRRFIANVSLQRRSDFCDVTALAGEVGDAVSVVRETQLNPEFAFASPDAAMGTITLAQPASQPRPHAWMRSNPTYTRRGNIATTAAASQGDSSTASATGRGSHVRSVEAAATTVDTGDGSPRGRRRRRTNTMPSPTSARTAAAPATRSRLQKERF